jgi:hypothetical protein
MQKLALFVAVCVTLTGTAGCTYTFAEGDIFAPFPAKSQFRSYLHVVSMPTQKRMFATAAEAVEVEVEPGITLRGWYFHSPANRRYVLYLHGRAGLAEGIQAIAPWFVHDLNVNVLCLDYRGYGHSDGKSSLQTAMSDAVKAYDELAERRVAPDEPIILYGYSLGAAFAMHVATQREPAALVLQSPFCSAVDFCEGFPPWYLRWLVRFKPSRELESWSPQPIDMVKTIETPLLILHGEGDEVIPIDQSRKLMDNAASEQKYFVPVPNTGHDGMRIYMPPLKATIRLFLDYATGEKYATPRSLRESLQNYEDETEETEVKVE